jgi:hypothetical protein
MPLFRLKAGAHIVGQDGLDKQGNPTQAQYFVASDPLRNIVESDKPLNELYPDRFEEFKGELPQGMKDRRLVAAALPPAPPPPGPQQFMEAENMRSMSAEELKVRAEWMRKAAEDLEKRAQEAEKGSQGGESQGDQQKMDQMQKEGRTPMHPSQPESSPGQGTVVGKSPGQVQLEQAQQAQQGKQQGEKGQQEKPQQTSQGKPAPQAADDRLEQRTVEELKEIAEEEEVDIRGATRKDELIARIRKSRE